MKTFGRYTVIQRTDEDGTYWELMNEWEETLWNYDTEKEATKEAKRMARDDQLDEEAMARGD